MKIYTHRSKLMYFAIFLMIFDSFRPLLFSLDTSLYLSIVGRIVYPILLFLFADSFYHTTNKKKIMIGLLLLSWLLSLGYGLIDHFIVPIGWQNYENIFMTLLIVAMFNVGTDYLRKYRKQLGRKNYIPLFQGIGMILLPFILSFLVFEIGMFFMKPTFSKAIVYYIVGAVMLMLPSLFVIHTGVMMVILGWLFYIFRKRRGIQYLLILVYSIFSFLLHPYSLQWTMVFSIIAIHFIHREKKEKITTTSDISE